MPLLASAAVMALPQVSHLSRPLSRYGLEALRGFTFFGAGERSSLLTLRNSCLETMAGCASSTRTGAWPSFALIPQTTAPVYASLSNMVWMVVLSHFLPLTVGMPSALRVLVMSRMLLPCRAMSKMRRTTASAGWSSSSLGRFFGPSWT